MEKSPRRIWSEVEHRQNPIQIDGQPLNKTTEFKYFGAVIDSEGETTKDTRARVTATWNKWRQVTGVLLPQNTNQLKIEDIQDGTTTSGVRYMEVSVRRQQPRTPRKCT